MQTFMVSDPGTGFYMGLEQLDDKRLGKQRLEAKQIYLTIESGFTLGYKNHPACKMWIGHLDSLALYGFICCQIWMRRGFTDNLAEWFSERANGEDVDKYPSWVSEPWLVASHRSKLIGKDMDFYKPKFPDTVKMLPYIWPLRQSDGGWKFFISEAEFKRKDYVTPLAWTVNQLTREVTFNG